MASRVTRSDMIASRRAERWKVSSCPSGIIRRKTASSGLGGNSSSVAHETPRMTDGEKLAPIGALATSPSSRSNWTTLSGNAVGMFQQVFGLIDEDDELETHISAMV